MQNKIISTPDQDSCGENRAYQFGYNEIIGKRGNQEDALTWVLLESNLFENVTPIQVAHRLWTAYQNLSDALYPDFRKQWFESTKHQNSGSTGYQDSGSTASTTVIFGEHLVTATLADTIAFAVIYDTDGNVVKVERLNARICTPISEVKRIVDAGSFIMNNRVFGALAVSRAIGDHNMNQIPVEDYKHGVIPDADIDTWLLDEDYKRVVIPDADIDIWSLASVPKQYKIQILTTCDGFTEGLGKEGQTKKRHEAFMLECLNKMNDKKPGLLSELTITKKLTQYAYELGSGDNISISAQTYLRGFNVLTGIYDGHAGKQTSRYVAKNIVDEFVRLLKLSDADYANEKNSVIKRQKDYERDNSHLKCRDLGEGLATVAPNPRDEKVLPVTVLCVEKEALPAPVTAPEAKKSPPAKPDSQNKIIVHLDQINHVFSQFDRYVQNKYKGNQSILKESQTFLTEAKKACSSIIEKHPQYNQQQLNEHVCKELTKIAGRTFKHRDFYKRLLADFFFIPLGVATAGILFAVKYKTTSSLSFLAHKTHRQQKVDELIINSIQPTRR